MLKSKNNLSHKPWVKEIWPEFNEAKRPEKSSKTSENGFSQINLASDIDKVANTTNAQVINSWGAVVWNTLLYVAQNGSGVVTAHNPETGEQVGSQLIVIDGSPTGIVINNTSGFTISKNNVTQPAQLIIVTENGSIQGYNPAVDPNNFIVVHSDANAVYKGLELLGQQLHVCNFNSGVVEIYGHTFNFLSSYTDSSLSEIGYAPFNIKAWDGNLIVAFAQQDEDKHDDVHGIGNGFIDLFDSQGNLSQRLINRGYLNSPWALLPLKNDIFQKCGGILLVGNFGDGKILLYNLETLELISALKDSNGNDIIIDSLWSVISRGNKGRISDGLYFTAGIDAEAHGLVGALKSAGF